MTDTELYHLAKEAYKNSYALYSKTNVGCALLCEDGKVYTGCNIENASYGLTICAERVALYKAISEGNRKPVKIAIASNQDKPFPPCGACRQVLAEFNPDIEVVWQTKGGNLLKKTLAELLPEPFD